MSRQGPRLHRLPKRTDYILIPPPLDLTLPLVDEKSSLPAIIVTPSSPSSSRDFAIAFLAAPPKPSLCERFLSTFFPSSSSSSSASSASRTSSTNGTRTGPIALASDAPASTPLTDAERKPLFRLVSTSTNGGNSNSHPATGSGGSLRLRTRSIMLILLVLFVLLCHLVTHRLAVRGPFLDLDLDVPGSNSHPGSDSELGSTLGSAVFEQEEQEKKGVQGWFEVLLGPFGVSSSSPSSHSHASPDPNPDMDTDIDLDLDVHAKPDLTQDIEEDLSASPSA